MGEVKNPEAACFEHGERRHPILWVQPPRTLWPVPDVGDETMLKIFGPGASKSLKSWGHDEFDVHYLATRSGTPLHEDHNFTRYTHHLILRNDGFRLHGLDVGHPERRLTVGTMYCMDTWSPHKGSVDPRMTPPDGKKPVYKIMLVVDRDEPLEPEAAWELLSRRLHDTEPLAGLTGGRQAGKRSKVKVGAGMGMGAMG